MSNSAPPKPTASLSDLQTCLRLSSEAETSALLKADEVMESFRLYRNRCLVSKRMRALDMPDWKDVDAWLYELKTDPEVRRYLRQSASTSTPTPTSKSATSDEGGKGEAKRGTQGGVKTLENYLASICRDKPYELMPHVAMFALRVGAFLMSEKGARFDVGKGAGEGSVSKGGLGGEREFDRALRIMKILGFLVARDVG
jgi:hypothetical protein